MGDVLKIQPYERPDETTAVVALAASADGTLAASLHRNGDLNTWESVPDIGEEGLDQAQTAADRQLQDRLLADDVLGAIRSDATLSTAQQQWALRLLRNRLTTAEPASEGRLNNQLRQIFSRARLAGRYVCLGPGQIYQLTGAARTTPNPEFEVTRGMAQYRAGQHEAAIRTLEPLHQDKKASIQVPGRCLPCHGPGGKGPK